VVRPYADLKVNPVRTQGLRELPKKTAYIGRWRKGALQSDTNRLIPCLGELRRELAIKYE
jgi:hypothetical protein